MIDDIINHRFLLMKWYSLVHYPIDADIKKVQLFLSEDSLNL